MRSLAAKAESLTLLLDALSIALARAEDAVAVEGGVPGGDDGELRGVALGLRTLLGQVAGMTVGVAIRRDGPNQPR